uniref:Variable surface glycoprotein 1 n=1 Tax=Trypanosoma equiperdum TaxID=5694 RepID=A0A0M4BVS2_TRYEQ|nr:variable surface glycoprotein 1 [Trypanosoma equiperdum]
MWRHIFLTALLFAVVPIEATHMKPLKPSGWKPLCDVAAALFTKASEAQSNAASTRNLARHLLQKQLRTLILLQSQKIPNDDARFQTIAAYLRRKAAAAAAPLVSETTPPVEKVLKATQFALGHLREFMVIATGTVQSGSAGCISNHNSDGSDEIKTLATLSSKYGACKALEQQQPTDYNPANVLSSTGLKQFADAQTGAITGSAEKGCKLLTTEDNNGYVHGTTNADTVPMAGGLLSIGNRVAEYNTHGNLKTNQATANNKIMKDAWQQIQNTGTKAEDYTDADINTLKGDPAFQEAFKEIYNIAAGVDGQLLENQITTNFPPTGTAFTQQIWDKIRDAKIPYELAGQTKGTKIGTIEDIEVLTKILNNFTGERLKSEREAAKRQSETKCNTEATQQTKTVECSTLEKTECKPDVGCKYNETSKACEKDPKPAVSKTNQETGGKDGETEEKCAKHGTDKNACEKDNNCKWENNACKDSSILVNKQLALSVVSAAFVALLF